MNTTIYLVTGAPGAGKSLALEHVLARNSPYLAFDIDWLAAPASQLARTDIMSTSTTWPAYNAVWLEFLHAIHKNHRRAIFFSPLDQRDLALSGQPAWCERIEWLLLDCADHTRRTRLRQRPGWTEAMIAEALADAQVLREQISAQIDTGSATPDEVAAAILDWVERLGIRD